MAVLCRIVDVTSNLVPCAYNFRLTDAISGVKTLQRNNHAGSSDLHRVGVLVLRSRANVLDMGKETLALEFRFKEAFLDVQSEQTNSTFLLSLKENFTR